MKRSHPGSAFSIPSDPAKARETRREQTARLIKGALDECGLSERVVAASLDISPAELDRLTSSTSGRYMTLADVRGLPAHAQRLIVARLAEDLGLAVVDRPEPASALDGMELCSRAMREAAEVVAEHCSAMRDGHITRAEGTKLERECDEAVAAIMSIRELARTAQREGVVGVSGRPS